MQRYILVRFLQSLLALWVMSVIVFSLARMTGDPLDVLLPMEAGEGERERVAKHWGLDKPLFLNLENPFDAQYFTFLGKALRGDFGMSWKWQGHTAMGLVIERLPATLELAGVAILISALLALPFGVLTAVWKDTFFDSFGKI
ncbi:MAG: ABC transporter permease, partial [Candidatus Tectomicrobia bacterium]|nr:ABC transporter permease [Candidatus Tectomicrobia bacterium]